MTEAMPPQPTEYHGRITAPVRCVRCRMTTANPHLLEWLPHQPPRADGYQRGVCVACANGLTGRRVTVPASVMRDVQDAVGTE